MVEAARILASGGRFYATVFLAPAPLHLEPILQPPGEIRTRFDADPFHISLDELAFLARCSGLEVEQIEEWRHPRGQVMLRFSRQRQASPRLLVRPALAESVFQGVRHTQAGLFTLENVSFDDTSMQPADLDKRMRPGFNVKAARLLRWLKGFVDALNRPRLDGLMEERSLMMAKQAAGAGVGVPA